MEDAGGAATGSQSVEIEYSLGYKSGTSAVVGDGFGFTYEFVNPPVTAALNLAPAYNPIPEPSTWTMMALGFTGLAFAGYRRSRTRAVFTV